MRSSKNELILDAACGTDEITYVFYKDGYKVKGCDFSDYLICKAKLNFPNVDFYVDNLSCLDKTKRCFDKIFVNNAIFYVHLKFLTKALQGLHSLLSREGKLYLFDWPDFIKRERIMNKGITYLSFPCLSTNS